MISWFLLVPVLVPVLVSLLSFVTKRVSFHFNFLVSPRSGSGSGAYVPSSPFFSLSEENGFCHDCMVLFLLRLLVFLFRFHL